MTPKEYAISLGLAKPGRGRLSLDAHKAIEKAKSEGMVFDDPKTVKRPSGDHRRPDDRPVAVDERPRNSLGQLEPGGAMYVPRVDPVILDVESLVAVDDRGLHCTFYTCSTCGMHVKYCSCPEIGLPYGCVRLSESSIEIVTNREVR